MRSGGLLYRRDMSDQNCLPRLLTSFAAGPDRLVPRRHSWLMRIVVAALSLGWIAPSCSAIPPRTVYVVEQSTHLRCGPGDDYYRTDPLRHGQSLDVYAQTPDGWLGVAPPDDSFDWVPADAIAIHPGGQTGTVAEDDLVVWIGTHLGRARKYRWQVQLAIDEEVVILNRAQREGPDGPQTWLQIVPPSGEFRWIHQDDVVNTSEELIARVNELLTNNESASSAHTDFERSTQSNPSNRPVRTAARPTRREDRPQLSRLPSRRERRRRDESERIETTERMEPSDQTDDPSDSRLAKIKRAGQSILLSRLLHSDSKADVDSGIGSKTDLATRDLATRNDAAAPNEISSDGPKPSSRRSADSSADSLLSGTSAMPPQELIPEPVPGGRPKSLTPVTDLIGAPEATAASSSPVQSPSSHGGLPSVAPVGFQTSVATIVGSNLSMPSIAHPPRPGQPSVAVSQSRIDQLRRRVEQADAPELAMVLSELMTRRSSSIETEVLLDRLRSGDAVAVAAGNQLLPRAQRYYQLAIRREGSPPRVIQDAETAGSSLQGMSPPNAWSAAPSADTVAESNLDSTSVIAPVQSDVQGHRTEPINVTESVKSTEPINLAERTNLAEQINLAERTRTNLAEPGDPIDQVAGQLLRVYSARPGAPPFSLTDAGGRTLCYVTPVPGVDLRQHVNSQVELVGVRERLAGLSTENLRVSSVVLR